MGNWKFRFCFALCVGAIILAACACGKHHGVSTSQLATPSTQQSAITEPDAGAVDAQGAWPTDQELIQRYISAKAAKLASDAGVKSSSLVMNPLGDEVKIENAWIEEIDGRTCITFPYKNPGDYNLDGMVDLEDLTALSQYFGQVVTENPMAQAADGNGDGVVNTADISVVVRYLYRRYGGASVYWSMTEYGDREELELYYVKGRYQDERGQVVYSFDLGNVKEHGWFWIQPRFHDLGEGPISDAFFLAPEDGAPHIKGVEPNNPAVDLYESLYLWVTSTGAEPCTVTWDFGPNTDPYWPSESEYRWARVIFSSPGPQRCTVTVENALGKDEYVFVVQVLPWSDFHPTIDNVKVLGALNPGEAVFFTLEGHIPNEAEYYWDFGGATTSGGSFEKSPTVTMGAPGKYYASVLVISDYGYVIHHFVIDVAHSDSEVEPNDTPAQADRLPPANTFDEFSLNASIGKMETSIDMADWFLISVPQGQRVRALSASGLIVRVYDGHMVEVPESTGTASSMTSVVFTASKSGSYYIQVVPQDPGVTIDYSLTITNLEPNKYDEYESSRIPPQPIEFPLDEFSGRLHLLVDPLRWDQSDEFRFKALVGQHLRLTADVTQLLGDLKEVDVSIWFKGNYTSEDKATNNILIADSKTDNQTTALDEILPYSGYYEISLRCWPSIGYDLEYELNGTLTFDNPKPNNILPHNATLNKPTIIYADIPGADNASYYWEFSDGATPRISSQNRPTVTFSKTGQFAGRVTITNGGTPSVTDFTILVDEWKREAITAGKFYKGSSDLSLVIGDDDVMHVITGYRDYFYRDESGWHIGPDLPKSIDIWDTTLSINGSGSPVALGMSDYYLALFTLNSSTWDSQLLGETPIKVEYMLTYPRLTRSLSGRLGAICPSEVINEHGQGETGLTCLWQTQTDWETSFIGRYDHNSSFDPNIAVSPSGVPYFCYIPFYLDKDPDSSFSISHWDGGGWIKEDLIVPGEEKANTRCAYIYFDAAEIPHIIFNNYAVMEICEAWKDGAEWRYETVMKASDSAWMNNWALDQDSQLMPWFVVLQSYDDGTDNGDAFVVHKEGPRWISEQVVSDILLWDWMDLALDSNDNPHLVYPDGDVKVHAWKE